MVESPFRHRWRLLLPLFSIVGLIGITTSLLLASQVFERDRQRQTMISDTLWAEQAVAFEGQRLIDALQAIGRAPAELSIEDMFRRKSASVIQRSSEVNRIYLWRAGATENWHYPAADGSSDDAQAADEADISATAQRAIRLNRATAHDAAVARGLMLIAVPIEHDAQGRAAAIVATVSLARMLANTIPWWFAHETRITLDDESGATLATRDPNLQGRGVYMHKIATQIADRTLYLNADSIHGAPSPVPNLLAASMCLLSALLAWAVYALWRDLSRRTKAEAALREQQAFRTAMENSLVTGLYARDMQGTITYANPAFCELIGHPLADVIGMRSPLPFWAPEAEHQHPESVLMKRDGTRVDVLVHEAPLLDGSGGQIGWMASMLDVSEQKRNAEFLRQQNERMHKMSRLMTMGEMASALAHELNQPLAAINAYIMAGLNTVEGTPDSRQVQEAATYFAKAKAQTDRAGMVIRRVRQFVGPSGPAVGAIVLDDVLGEVLQLARLQSNRYDEQVALSLGHGEGQVLADRVLLEQVLLNLTKNAFEAMTEGAAARHQVVIYTEADPELPDVVTVGVRDTGPGLGPEHDRFMTQSFSTTKPGGLGMGLAVCRTALDLMGSRLHYRPAAGGGAEFRFTLRRAVDAPTGRTASEARPAMTLEGSDR